LIRVGQNQNLASPKAFDLLRLSLYSKLKTFVSLKVGYTERGLRRWSK